MTRSVRGIKSPHALIRIAANNVISIIYVKNEMI